MSPTDGAVIFGFASVILLLSSAAADEKGAARFALAIAAIFCALLCIANVILAKGG